MCGALIERGVALIFGTADLRCSGPGKPEGLRRHDVPSTIYRLSRCLINQNLGPITRPVSAIFIVGARPKSVTGEGSRIGAFRIMSP